MVLAIMLNNWFGWYETKEQRKKRLEDEQQVANLDAEIRRLQDARQKAITSIPQQQAVSQAAHQALITLGDKIAARLLACENELCHQRELTKSLHEGNDGKLIASQPTLVFAFGKLEETPRPTEEEIKSQRAELATLLGTVNEAIKATANVQPPALELIQSLERLDARSLVTQSDLRKLRLGLEDILAIAQKTGTRSEVTLSIALQKQRQSEAEASWKRLKELRDQARKAADETLARQEAELIKAETDAKAKSLAVARESAAALAQAEQEKGKRIARCRSPEVLQLLSPFISKGLWQPGMKAVMGQAANEWRPASDWKPVSLNLLMEQGALRQDNDGLQTLLFCGTSFHHFPAYDRYRPRWVWPNRLSKLSADQRQRLEQAQRLLIELGSQLVELGLLSP